MSIEYLRRRFARILSLIVLAVGSLALASCSSREQGEWPSFNGGPDEQRFSPLTEIDTSNVKDLSLAWHYELPSGNSLSGPIEADGKVFVTSGLSYVRAFDAATGKLLWEYDSKTAELAKNLLIAGWGSKGIAYWNGRVIVATPEGRVIGLDADNGKPVWENKHFENGEMRYTNGPPRVFDGKVIIGHGGADMSPIRGYVDAFDAMTGKKLWRFYTVPGDPAKGFENDAMKMAAKTWTGEWWKHGGGGTAWNAFSYDPELNLIYIGVGNGYPYNQAIRSPQGGDNLFLASIVAVKADTGEYAWHYQVCPGDQWDCTAVQDMTLATLNIGGRERKVIMQAPKNGFFYVLDRATGEFISAEPFAKVTWASKIDPKTHRPVENPGIRYHGKDMFELWPSVRGAHSWLPQSFSPKTGLVYLPVIEGGSVIGDKGVDLTQPGMGVMTLADPALPGSRRSFLKAWDPVAQKARWSVELPGNWPGGTMVTAGNLVFQGRMDGQFVAYDAATGKVVWTFQAGAPIVAPPISYSAGGKQYVTVVTGSGASGGGIFAAGNEKYRTDYRMPRNVLTFALGGTDKLEITKPQPMTAPVDADYHPNPALEAKGAMAFAMNACIVCHGTDAVGGGAAPDLRASPYPANKEAFTAAVLQGSLTKAGMPSFAHVPPDTVEAIRQYLRARGQQLGKPAAAQTTTQAPVPNAALR